MIIRTIEEVLKINKGVILTTLDSQGFPHNQLFSKPVYRNNYYSMLFIIEEDLKLRQSLEQNSRAALCFFTTETFEAVIIKGIVTLQEEINEFQIQKYTKKYPQLKKLNKPLCIYFQTLSVNLNRTERLGELEV